MSTRRLYARAIVCNLSRVFFWSSALRSELCSTSCFTSSELRFFSSPNACVSMFAFRNPLFNEELLGDFRAPF